MNKAQRKKRGYGLQIAGHSRAVYKALIDGTRSIQQLCKQPDKMDTVQHSLQYLLVWCSYTWYIYLLFRHYELENTK